MTPASIEQMTHLPAPTPLRPQTRIAASWAAISEGLNDPHWVPSWSAAPIWAIDPDAVADAITEHSGSDTLTARQVADLVGRIARRNALEARRLLARMEEGGLESLAESWARVLEGWAASGIDGAAPHIAGYLATAARLGLTPAQASAWAACPSSELREAISQPGPVARAQAAMMAHPTATYAEVARLAGISPGYARMIVTRHGDPCREERRRDERPARVRALATEGMSYRQIAASVGCSVGYVRKVLA